VSQPIPSPTDASFAELWKKICALLSRELSERSFKTWFEPISLLGISSDSLILSVPDQYYGKWLEDHYQNLILSSAEEVLGHPLRIAYQVVEPPRVIPPLPSQPTSRGKEESFSGLNQRYTFDAFVIGPGNRFAHAASVAVSESPAKQYNPLFIYGPTGLGKTHLLHSIANATIKCHPEFKVLYISSEKFTNQLISAIQTKTTPQFRAKYRSLDLLLIDDVHFIAEKNSTQEEFFNTFNALYDNAKQIVVTSDKFPKDIPNFEERLRSRFEWGLIADIQPPDLETKVAILNKKAEFENVALPQDVAFYLASNTDHNIRVLEGSLIRLSAFASLRNIPITMTLAKEVMGNIISDKKKEITIDMITKEVASYFSVKVSDLKSAKRIKSIMLPRQIAIFLSRRLTGNSLVSIGEKFGGKDHATIIHSIKKVEEEMKAKKDLKETVEKIELRVKST